MYKEPITLYGRTVEAFKRKLIQATLEAYDGNRTHAARTLGLQRTYLVRLIGEFGISVPIPKRVREGETEWVRMSPPVFLSKPAPNANPRPVSTTRTAENGPGMRAEGGRPS